MRSLSEVPFGEIEASLARIARPEHNAFVALNTASLDDAVVLEIAPGAVIADPIEVVWTSPPADRPQVTHPRLLILAGERSQASVVEAYAGEGRYFRNAVTEIVRPTPDNKLIINLPSTVEMSTPTRR